MNMSKLGSALCQDLRKDGRLHGQQVGVLLLWFQRQEEAGQGQGGDCAERSSQCGRGEMINHLR